MFPKTQRQYTKNEALEKLRAYCAYQERSKKQTVQKMRQLALDPEWFEGLLEILVEEGFLNETRFATQFARGKSKGRGWGPLKIKNKLQFELKPEDVQIGMENVDMESAQLKLVKALTRKKEELERKSDAQLKQKLLRFCMSRGFEFDFSLKLINKEFGI